MNAVQQIHSAPMFARIKALFFISYPQLLFLKGRGGLSLGKGLWLENDILRAACHILEFVCWVILILEKS